MSEEPFYVARAAIEKIAGVHRTARLAATGDTIEFGVHGAIRRFYDLETDADRPLPVDYIVAATGG